MKYVLSFYTAHGQRFVEDFDGTRIYECDQIEKARRFTLAQARRAKSYLRRWHKHAAGISPESKPGKRIS
jgi:hypothetical protein